MERFGGKVAVVTGSSSGIGAALSKELTKHGVIVVGLARRIEKLQELATEISANANQYPGKFYALKCDITKEMEIKSSFQWITSKLGPVSILVNNAAVLETSLLSDITAEMITKSFDTNVKGVLLCSKEVMKLMIDNSIDGHIININSIAGQVIISVEPNLYILYSSTKHALRVISEGLRRELINKKTNIKVTNISPGYVSTEMTDAITNLPAEFQGAALEAKDVAQACISALNTPPHVLVSELTVMPIHQHV